VSSETPPSKCYIIDRQEDVIQEGQEEDGFIFEEWNGLTSSALADYDYYGYDNDHYYPYRNLKML
jgi:hypothetical protein